MFSDGKIPDVSTQAGNHLESVRPLVPVSDTSVSKDQHPVLVYLAKLAPGSRRAMSQALNTIAGLLTSNRADALQIDWAALRYQHTAAVRASLADRFAPMTVNRMLAALRGVLKEAWRLGLMDAETYHRATDLPSVRGERLPKGRRLTGGELRALCDVCAQDDTPAGARDVAMLALGYGAGLRRAEIVALDMSDYDAESGALTIRSGKGRKDRLVYATNGSRDALGAWLRVRGSQPGPLFVGINKGGRLLPSRLSDQGVLRMVMKRGAEAGVKAFSPHDLRRSFISDLLDQGADLVTVQALAGHSNVQTTARYDRRGEKAKKRASELLHVPFASE